MLLKKICLLGSYSVGKTSLVSRFVHSLFSEKYQTTVGVKIDKKEVVCDGVPVRLMIWDIAGEDDYSSLRMSYLKGAAGYFLVVDGTRRQTLEKANDIFERAKGVLPGVPSLMLLNKSDLEDEWELDRPTLRDLEENRKGSILKVSAKLSEGVEEAFINLTRAMLGIRHVSALPPSGEQERGNLG